MRILLVDDDSLFSGLIRLLLEQDGHDVVVARDGLEALRLLEVDGIEVVITDVRMPGISGFELCRQIRNNEKLADLPVVIYTAARLPDTVTGLMTSFGADLWIEKPNNIFGLRAALSEVMYIRANRLLKERDHATQ